MADYKSAADVTDPLYTPALGDLDERLGKLAQRSRDAQKGRWVKEQTKKPGISRLAAWVAAAKDPAARAELEKRWQKQDQRKASDAAKDAQEEMAQRKRVEDARRSLAGGGGPAK
jgi:hypothetical protein